MIGQNILRGQTYVWGKYTKYNKINNNSENFRRKRSRLVGLRHLAPFSYGPEKMKEMLHVFSVLSIFLAKFPAALAEWLNFKWK